MAMDDGDGVDCAGRRVDNDLLAALGDMGTHSFIDRKYGRYATQTIYCCKNTATDGLSPKTTWVLTDYLSQTFSGFFLKCVTGEKIWFQAT